MSSCLSEGSKKGASFPIISQQKSKFADVDMQISRVIFHFTEDTEQKKLKCRRLQMRHYFYRFQYSYFKLFVQEKVATLSIMLYINLSALYIYESWGMFAF